MDSGAVDWRARLLKRFSFPQYQRLGRNPLRWLGYDAGEALRYGIGAIGGHNCVAAVWDFSVHGGSLGELDATAFSEAVDRAIEYGEPLVSFVRSGGVRLQEGMAALVGIPRCLIALRRLAAAGVPHIAVADEPTTGGVFVGVVATADVRLAVAGATVGFAGPRVVESVTGTALPAGANTAESAYAAGLVDAVVEGDEVGGWLGAALAALRAGDGEGHHSAADLEGTPAAPADLVASARDPLRPSGREVLSNLVPDGVPLRARGDETVRAVFGHLPDGTAVVACAVAADRATRVTPAGFELVARAAEVADRWRRPLVTLVDTPGAEPGPAAEDAGLAAAIARTATALLDCAAPTLAVVIGEGGSGGALAAALTDEILMSPGAYFAAIGPEGAAATLRVPAAEAIGQMGVDVATLSALGLVTPTVEPTDPVFADVVSAHLRTLASQTDRAARRTARWSSPLPGRVR
jgi:acetyl-CoA carboxylase carboxyl transferase subunit beta